MGYCILGRCVRHLEIVNFNGQLSLAPEEPGEGKDDTGGSDELPDGGESLIEKEGGENQGTDQADWHHAANKWRSQPLNGTNLTQVGSQ